MSSSLPAIDSGLLAAVETDDVREQLDLLGQEVAMGAVDLPVGVAGVEEEHRVLALGAALAAVEEPERHGQRDRVEEVRADRDHHVDGAAPR